MRDKIRMIGYNSAGRVVYTDCLDTGDFYDEEHVWDSSVATLELGLVKVVGEKFDGEGNVAETWETAFSPKTGISIGGVCTYADGTIKRIGIYEAA